MSTLTLAPETLIGASAVLRDHDRTRVMLIAGNTHATETLCELLEALGYQVQTAPTANAARLQRPPAVIIADACLPDGGAAGLLQTLRRLPGWDSVPAIALGGIDPAGAWAETAGFSAVLSKPISIWALHRALQGALRLGAPRAHRRW
ncbi:MAG: response regulator [Actinomycetota bacterium]